MDISLPGEGRCRLRWVLSSNVAPSGSPLYAIAKHGMLMRGTISHKCAHISTFQRVWGGEGDVVPLHIADMWDDPLPYQVLVLLTLHLKDLSPG